MMRGKVEPSIEPTMVQAMPTMVHAVRQTSIMPQMTSPHNRQLKEQRQEIPHMTSP
jgi:hypothetical protein